MDRAVTDGFANLWRPVKEAQALSRESKPVEKGIWRVGDAMCNRFLLFKHEGKWRSLYLANNQL